VDGIPDIDLTDLLRRVGGDELLMTQVLELFLEGCPRQLDALETALAESNAISICAAAHSIKGMAGNVSALGLAGAAAVVERMGTAEQLDSVTAAGQALSAQAARALNAARQGVATAVRPL
jgi:HPt (histidine-containing phosphotransfer) domain-containing protein